MFLLVAAVIAGVGYFGYQYTQARTEVATDETTGCLKNAPTPTAALFLVDATDRLSKENAERIGARIRDEVDTLERHGRVIIVWFGDDTAAPLPQIFNGCVPGNADSARWDEGAQVLAKQYDNFQADLSGLVEQLQRLPDSRTSPITEQVIRAASDPQLRWDGNVRKLILITDGLESSIYWTRNLKLPDPPTGLLTDVSAEYFEVGNSRANRLQNRDLRLEWQRWLEGAGASVRITAPGFSAYTPRPAS